MEARAWRLAGGAAVALLVLVALVAWRADSLAGGWLLALRLAGLVAVAGLLTAVALATRTALRPPVPAAVLVRVPVDGAPHATAQAARAAAVPLQAVVLLAVVSAAPVLGVLVLATGPEAELSSSAGDGAAPRAEPTAGVPATPSTATPSVGPAPAEPPTAGAPPSPSTAPELSPAQLPSGAGGRAVCEQVVVAGDSLWSVAAAQLGPGAADADVDARWRALYARNLAAVGPDPDLVRPGLQLSTCA